jgi:hypothetical protein
MDNSQPAPTRRTEHGRDRVVIRIEADSTDEELYQMAEAFTEWVEETWARHHPGESFFLPDDAADD